ncbi:MAG: glutaminyl-peptide cyclotransferase [Planctomycetes bacterium]|nr:glutaminyl-peptide cyclotransferase [Planctomycetota bacterium]
MRRLPHDSRAYTQGLLFHDGSFYESSGGYGRSWLRQVEPESGRVLKEVRQAPNVFAEGLALHASTLYQLSWKNQRVALYSLPELKALTTFPYLGDGWGLTSDGQTLIMSDGTEFLRFMDPLTFRELRRARVMQDGRARDQLNELEFVDGRVLANVWKSDEVLVIEPRSGQVTGTIDLSHLIERVPDDPDAVLNGIAYDPDGERLFVTGKLWPTLFEIRLVPKPQQHER